MIKENIPKGYIYLKIMSRLNFYMEIRQKKQDRNEETWLARLLTHFWCLSETGTQMSSILYDMASILRYANVIHYTTWPQYKYWLDDDDEWIWDCFVAFHDSKNEKIETCNKEKVKWNNQAGDFVVVEGMLSLLIFELCSLWS